MNQSAHILYHMVKRRLSGARSPLQLPADPGGRSILAYAITAEKVGSRGGRLSRPIQLGVDRHDDGDLLLDVSVTGGLLHGQEFSERDHRTRVGKILAATPMRKEFYTIAKTVSNFAVLACMVAVLMVAAIAMQVDTPGSAADFALAVLVTVHVLCLASHVRYGQSGCAVRDLASVAQRRRKRRLFLRVDVRSRRWAREASTTRAGSKFLIAARGELGEIESGAMQNSVSA